MTFRTGLTLLQYIVAFDPLVRYLYLLMYFKIHFILFCLQFLSFLTGRVFQYRLFGVDWIDFCRLQACMYLTSSMPTASFLSMKTDAEYLMVRKNIREK